MRRKRKKRKRHLSKSSYNIYSFKNLQIESLVLLNNEQLNSLRNKINKIVNSNKGKTVNVIARQIVVKMKPIICAVQYNKEKLCYVVQVMEYLN